jgi:hypothetical protein
MPAGREVRSAISQYRSVMVVASPRKVTDWPAHRHANASPSLLIVDTAESWSSPTGQVRRPRYTHAWRP